MEGKQVCPESESCLYACPNCKAPTENSCLNYINSLKERFDIEAKRADKLYMDNIRLQGAIMNACKAIKNFSQSVCKLQDTVTTLNTIAREMKDRYYDI